MDYLFASSIVGCSLQLVTVSYDVGCQWFTNFWTRAKLLPASIGFSLPSLNIRALVPKFHLQSHIEACHSAFSFNFFKGGARTDGEGVERNWDELNGQGPSTSEMLPGARWNTLDDCCGWVNWRKTMGLGASHAFFVHIICSLYDVAGNLLLKRLLVAITQANRSKKDFTLFDASLREENPEEVAKAERDLAAWNEDHSCPDPYRLPKSSE
jgi:Kyakuja-Dileera-Zisupton transposase